MDTLRQLDSGLYVSAQLLPEDLELLLTRGIRSVINNRPDGEAPDQPQADALASAARRAGLRYLALPVVVGQVTDAQVLAFSTALRELPGPVVAFCRTGTRSTTLWALGQAGLRTPQQILQTAAGAGYDLGGLAGRLVSRILPDD